MTTQETEGKLLDIALKIATGANAIEKVLPEWLEIADEASATMEYEIATGIVANAGAGEETLSWVVGDVVKGQVDRAMHGKKSQVLADIARDTNHSVSELREKMDCAAFWPPHVRKTIMARGGMPLTWSHFNRARRGMELATALSLLEKAVDHGWSVGKMGAEVNAKLAKARTKTKKGDADVNGLIEDALTALRRLNGAGLSTGAHTAIARCIEALEEELDDVA